MTTTTTKNAYLSQCEDDGQPCMASSSIQVPVASNTPVPTQSAPLTTAAGLANLPLVSLAPESSPEVSSIAAVRVPVLHDPPTQQPSFAPSPDSAQPSTSQDLPAPLVGHKLSSDYDPNVDVVGLGEDKDLPDISAVTQGGSVADSLRSTGPTLGGPLLLKSSPYFLKDQDLTAVLYFRRTLILTESPCLMLLFTSCSMILIKALVHPPNQIHPRQKTRQLRLTRGRPLLTTPHLQERGAHQQQVGAGKANALSPPQSNSSASIRPRQRNVIPHKAPEPSTSSYLMVPTQTNLHHPKAHGKVGCIQGSKKNDAVNSALIQVVPLLENPSSSEKPTSRLSRLGSKSNPPS
ncbi:hypothetical protein RHS01_11378 [Rhizoctonia solani]|uniref:Uncharacterized protein n=1 Tax=Rhizoctonia solani TaxID=456999 RepID=A0A8H7M1J8_9AGAM|nr:hypothetical protein RHS01_11378 [Rhizoctonia solani]